VAAEIITVGSEPIVGHDIDLDAAYVVGKLGAIGIEVDWKTAVGDDEGRIRDALRQALARNHLVVVIGGAGPTGDDRIRRAIAAVLGCAPVQDRESPAAIREQVAARELAMASRDERPAPRSDATTVVLNPRGTAAGLYVRTREAKVLVALPVGPGEIRPMLVDQVIPRLREERGVPARVWSRIVKACGITASAMEERIRDLRDSAGVPRITWRARPGELHARITVAAASAAEAVRRLDDAEAGLRDRLGDLVFGRDEERLEDAVARLLWDLKRTVAVAESCTGGLVSHRLTNVPGSSGYFLRGEVVYSNLAKEAGLGVPAAMIAEHGAVSRPVALAMAAGVRKASGADLAVAITGIAGPAGGTPQKPVGLTYVAIAWSAGTAAEEFRFLGDREMNKLLASQAALDMLRRHLLSHGDAAEG
jgi:nicotinamide-nucleotide amidase